MLCLLSNVFILVVWKRYREKATEERRLAEAEAATRTVRTLELGVAERTAEGARQLEQQLARDRRHKILISIQCS